MNFCGFSRLILIKLQESILIRYIVLFKENKWIISRTRSDDNNPKLLEHSSRPSWRTYVIEYHTSLHQVQDFISSPRYCCFFGMHISAKNFLDIIAYLRWLFSFSFWVEDLAVLDEFCSIMPNTPYSSKSAIFYFMKS